MTYPHAVCWPLLFALLAGVVACKDEPPPPPEPIVARIAHRPAQPGDSFRATVKTASVLARAPTKELKRIGVFRAVDVNSQLEAAMRVQLDERTKDGARWRIEFREVESVVETTGAKKAATDYALTGTNIVWERGDQGITMKTAEGAPATKSQGEIASALVRGFEVHEDWGEFLASREFAQGQIVEAPRGLYLGHLIEASLGAEIAKGHSTVSLFRLGLEDGSEVAHFEVDINLETERQEDLHYDALLAGKLVVRIVDGTLLSYQLAGKVTPRAPTGEMAPSGSGTWEVEFAVDPQSVPVTVN